jgi:L-ribulose-5-phosphate 4-epimerase
MAAVQYAAALEELAKMAILTYQVNPASAPLPEYVMRKHYERKHGKAAYYGQAK